MTRRYLFALAAGLAIASWACARPQTDRPAGDSSSAAAQWWTHVAALASDDMAGRQTGSDGHRQAARYVAEQFQRLGVRPAGTAGYLQPIEFEARALAEDRSRLELVRDGMTIPVRFGADAILRSVGRNGEPFEAGLVFVGYGLTIPEYDHDDFAKTNVAGKVVVLLAGAPASVPSTVAAHYSSFEERTANLERRGAVGAVMLPNPRLEEVPWERIAASRSQFTRAMDLAGPGLGTAQSVRLAASASPDFAATLLGVSRDRLADILKLDAERQPLPTFDVPGALRGVVAYDQSSTTSDNVVAMITGSDPALRDEYVLLSAHLDHVGVGNAIDGDSIYNGAMDNASGVATLLEVARMLRESDTPPRRSVLLLACTGEEMGLLGSKYYAARPTVPIGNVVANINLDMFLPIVPLRTVRGYGIGESNLVEDLDAAAREIGVRVQDDPEPERNIFIRSDQYSFIKRGVPALFLSVGWEPGSPDGKIVDSWFSSRYHAPSDDLSQPVDLDAAQQFNRLMTLLTTRLANAERRPEWNEGSFFRRFTQRQAAPVRR